MDIYDIYDVVEKLIGKIQPVGEINEDDNRYENLKDTIDLVDILLRDIHFVAKEENRQEFSRNRAGKLAKKFLDSLEPLESRYG